MENKNLSIAALVCAALAVGGVFVLLLRPVPQVPVSSAAPASVGDINVVVNGAPVNASAPGGSYAYPGGSASFEPKFGASSGTEFSTFASTSLSVVNVGGGASLSGLIHGTFTTNTFAIVDGSSASDDVSVSGASVGNPCIVSGRGNFSGTSSTMRLSCSVTAADTVQLTFSAVSTSVANLSSAVYDIVVLEF